MNKKIVLSLLCLGLLGQSALAQQVPSLGQTLNFIQDKLRDRGAFDYKYTRESAVTVFRHDETSMSSSLDACVVTLHWKNSYDDSMGHTNSLRVDFRIPLAELDAAKTTVETSASCIGRDDKQTTMPAGCYNISLRSKDGRNVIKAGDGNFSNLAVIRLAPTEGKLAAKMRDAFAHAIRQCQDEIEFPTENTGKSSTADEQGSKVVASFDSPAIALAPTKARAQ